MKREKRIKLLWVVDIAEELGQKLANQYDAKFSKNLSEALNDPQTNAVWISVSTPYHMDVIRQAAKAKKHIYCEKPISLKAEEVKKKKNSIFI
jgi:predicted dehydrogenase